MLKILALPALLVLLLSAAACASMSLEDYAEECGEWTDDYGNLFGGSFSGSTDASDMEDALDDWNAPQPAGRGEGPPRHQGRG